LRYEGNLSGWPLWPAFFLFPPFLVRCSDVAFPTTADRFPAPDSFPSSPVDFHGSRLVLMDCTMIETRRFKGSGAGA
jgi:hypothetical protein